MPISSRLLVSIPKASRDGRFYGRFPQGDAPVAAQLAGAAADVIAAAAALRTGVGLQGAAADAIAAAANLTTGSSGGPSAPTNLQILFQGMSAAGGGFSAGAPVPTNANTQAIGWVQGAQGANAITHNNIYRNTNGAGYVLYATIAAGTSFIDTAATNCVGSTALPHNSVGQAWAANGYLYKVSAVDSSGNEGPLSDPQIFVYYKNGQQLGTGGDVNNACTSNYVDTTGIAGNPFGSTKVLLNTTTSFGDWLPYAGNNGTQWNIWCGQGSPAQVFAFLNMSLKPSAANQTWNAWIEYRTDANIDPQGSQAGIVGLGNSSAVFGPPAVAGVWNTYKIPLSLLMKTAIVDYNGIVGGMFYKLGFADQSGLSTNHYWVDNVFLSPS